MKRTLFISLVLALILSACATLRAAKTEAPSQPQVEFYSGVNNALPQAGVGGGASPQEAYAPDAAMPLPTMMAPSNQVTSSGSVVSAPVERLVIQNADLVVVVADVNKRMKEIETMAKDMGGFVVSSNLYQSYTNNNSQVPEATVVIRVPAERLDEALDAIKKDAVEVQNENRTGQDVTNQYVDLQSQLKAKQAAEEQLLKIMQGAEKTDDVLAVYQQLQAIQSEIEVLKGQIKYYEESAALSAISVRLIAEETVQPIQVAGWRPQGVARDAIQDLINFLQNFADFMIRFFLSDLWKILLTALPFYILFLIARAIFRRVRANRPKKELVPPPPPATEQ